MGADGSDGRDQGRRSALAALPRGDVLLAAGTRLLAELAEANPGERRLVHADLLYRNVLVDNDRITGVIDWGCSLYGDPVYDLATLTLWAPWYEGLAAVGIEAAYRRHLRVSGRYVADLDARLRCCELHLALQGYGFSALLGAPEELPRIEAQLDRLLS